MSSAVVAPESVRGRSRYLARRMPERILTAVLLLLIVAPFLSRLALIERRGFNPDELEHLHFAWCVARGKVPYLDYFDHHTPWLHFMLRPLLASETMDTSPDEALRVIFRARLVMWGCAAAILALTFLLARATLGPRRALLATLLLNNTAVFLNKSFDVRPDGPATALVTAALLLQLLALRRLVAKRRGDGWLHFVSGVFLGAAIMFTQKTLFLGPGLAFFWIWAMLDRRVILDRSRGLLGLVAQAAGVILPVIVTLAFFARHGALSRFIVSNINVNTRWPGLGAGPILGVIVKDDPAFVALTLLGIALVLGRVRHSESFRNGEALVVFALLSPLLGLLVHPAVTLHYFLLFLPLAAIVAGSALMTSVRWAASRGRAAESNNRVDIILLIIVNAACVFPLIRLKRTFGRGNWSALQGIRYVIRNSAPWEKTVDGFSGLGVFRPQADYYPFFTSHTRIIMGREEQFRFLDRLRSGKVVPKMVFFDYDLEEGLARDVHAFLRHHYVPTGLPPIHIRVFDNGLGWWTDEGPRYVGWMRGKERSPHVYFGAGWRDPTVEDGLPSRRTRTHGSELQVPIRDPRNSRITIRAKAHREGLPFDVELIVNGRSAGHHPATPYWQDYVFWVPQRHLIQGFNVFELRCGDESSARRAEISVHLLSIERS